MKPDRLTRCFEKIDQYVTPEQQLDLLMKEADRLEGKRNTEAYALKLMAEDHRARNMSMQEFREGVIKVMNRLVREHSRREDGAFRLDMWNNDIFELLVLYFFNDPGFVEAAEAHTRKVEERVGKKFDFRFSLERDILLFGSVGCGKTILMEGFEVNPKASFYSVSCRDITDAFKDYKMDGKRNHVSGGAIVTRKYISPARPDLTMNIFNQETWGWNFDDLGMDDLECILFGNRSNVMADVLFERNKFTDRTTHITTNLNEEELSTRYGSRVASRLRQSHNFIIFPPGGPDRRR